MISYGSDPCNLFPGGFVQVSANLGWIQSVIGAPPALIGMNPSSAPALAPLSAMSRRRGLSVALLLAIIVTATNLVAPTRAGAIIGGSPSPLRVGSGDRRADRHALRPAVLRRHAGRSPVGAHCCALRGRLHRVARDHPRRPRHDEPHDAGARRDPRREHRDPPGVRSSGTPQRPRPSQPRLAVDDRAGALMSPDVEPAYDAATTTGLARRMGLDEPDRR